MNPIQITFRGMSTSEALAEHIRGEYDKLVELYHRISSAHAVVEQAHRHQQKGRHFQCHLTLRVPGKDLAVTRDPVDREAREDAYAAVDEVFQIARRMLQEHVEKVKLEGRHEELV
ncbi:MAG: HPF/RaiA family ribosome-associated protein [Myxococcaceae bacterium]